jgi:hypothetical protein
MEATATCAACGKPLEDRRRRYCSTVCKDRARRERAEAVVAHPDPIAQFAAEANPRERRKGLLAVGAVPLLIASGFYLLRRRR